jgi:hypothetical protein
MAIKKKYSKNKSLCKVTFLIPKEVGEQFEKITVVGDFNNWNPDEDRFVEKEKDGTFSVSLMLEGGKEYQFRYLGDGINWFNEPEADKEVESYYPGAYNSVVVV